MMLRLILKLDDFVVQMPSSDGQHKGSFSGARFVEFLERLSPFICIPAGNIYT
jgi:hypothetical protein